MEIWIPFNVDLHSDGPDFLELDKEIILIPGVRQIELRIEGGFTSKESSFVDEGCSVPWGVTYSSRG